MLNEKINEVITNGYSYFPVDCSETGEFATDFHDFCSDEGLNPHSYENVDDFIEIFYEWMEYITRCNYGFKTGDNLFTFIEHNNKKGVLVYGKLNLENHMNKNQFIAFMKSNWKYEIIDLKNEDINNFDSYELLVNNLLDKHF